jgi:hypothetical protein
MCIHRDGRWVGLEIQTGELDERGTGEPLAREKTPLASSSAPAAACHQAEVSARVRGARAYPPPITCCRYVQRPGRDARPIGLWRPGGLHVFVKVESSSNSTGRLLQASQGPTLPPGGARAYPPIFKISHIKPATPGDFRAAEPLRTRVRLNWGRWVYDRTCACVVWSA